MRKGRPDATDETWTPDEYDPSSGSYYFGGTHRTKPRIANGRTRLGPPFRIHAVEAPYGPVLQQTAFTATR
jgi:hypothetical protein